MEPRKLTKEDIDKVRHIDGFPIAKDEDIIALSNAPYYTACPNPFIEDFIKEHGKPYDEETDEYHREPFAADVSEGKTDAIYNAHMYHTKVPYKAIMRYILHYTNPGDLVYDGFCGTGMTGVAATKCGNPDNDFKFKIESEMKNVEWGRRSAILNDLSPAASFISRNYNSDINIIEFEKEARKILSETKNECEWMWRTAHSSSEISIFDDECIGDINYVAWSDVLICPNCGSDIIFGEVAFNIDTGKVSENFVCPNCNVNLKKTSCERKKNIVYDEISKQTIELAEQQPLLINYTYKNKKYEKKPDSKDLEIIKKVNDHAISYWYPKDYLPEGYNTQQPIRSHGINRIDLFYTKRILYALSKLFDLILKSVNRDSMMIWFTSQLINISKLNRYRPGVSFPYNPLSGTLYISSMICESNPFIAYSSKIKKFVSAFSTIKESNVIVSVNSTTNSENVNDNSIDYIFTDPPFGGNLNYSELSYIWESWLKVKTNNKNEAIINQVQRKGLFEYQELMTKCFTEYNRVLKPNRWMTVEFHNSKNSIWNSIQQALQHAGFIVADVRVLDKQLGTFKQVTSTSAVKQDLVISAYKPAEKFKREFITRAGSEEAVWDFVSQHLEKLPVVVLKERKIEIVVERQSFLLFDRMIAYHIMNGFSVPIDAIDFYKGLDDRFLKRDGMYFLPDQVNEYDTARITNDVEPIQFELFVTNEKSAIAWLYQQLGIPQTYAELQPKFMQEIKAWDKFEERPELNTLLEENFLQNEEGKWYVPDVTKAADVIKLREKKLLKEFEGYLSSKGKLKLFRTEAVRVGFAKLWTDKNYKLIVETADRLPESVIQEDDKLLMYYDISLGRI